MRVFDNQHHHEYMNIHEPFEDTPRAPQNSKVSGRATTWRQFESRDGLLVPPGPSLGKGKEDTYGTQEHIKFYMRSSGMRSQGTSNANKTSVFIWLSLHVSLQWGQIVGRKQADNIIHLNIKESSKCLVARLPSDTPLLI